MSDTTQAQHLKAAAQQALTVLRGCLEHPDAGDAISALQHAIAQPDATTQPVEWRYDFNGDWWHTDDEKKAKSIKADGRKIQPLFTTPQPGTACKRICELCVKRGYNFCANAVVTTPLPTTPQPAKPEPMALEAMRERKNAAYLERNQVVAALAKCFPSCVSSTAIEGWSEDWHGCVYIDLPTGQVSWHFHDLHAHLFDSLPHHEILWDGHTTAKKYERLAALEATQPAKPDSVAAEVIDNGFGGRMVATLQTELPPIGTKLYATPQPAPAPWVMLSKKEIQDAANAAVLNRDLSWLGFSVDSNGFYRIPVLSDCHFQLAHTVLAAFIAKQGAPK